MKIDHSQPLEYSTEQNQMNILGFWIFLGAEIMLFGTLFSSFFTLENGVGSGPTGTELFEIKPVILETIILLTSSFTIGLATHAMRIQNKKATLAFLLVTLLLGLSFVSLEVVEFITYFHEGLTLQTSAFSGMLFLTLGTHGAHVTFGLYWGFFIFLQLKKRGFTPATTNKAFIFSLYWHFLDVVWIFIFSFIYLKGMM